MKCSVISIDIAKNIFQVCALDTDRKPIFNKTIKRSALMSCLSQLEPTLVVMEACYSSNPWGRRIEKLGHTVKCIPAFMVKPFLIGNKTDRNDALAIAEAAFRPSIRFIVVKTVEKQDLQSLQRIRDRLIKIKTGSTNQLRGLLSEYGEVCPKTYAGIKSQLPSILEDPTNGLTSIARKFLNELHEDIKQLNNRIKQVTMEMATLAQQNADYARLIEIPGVGPIVAATLLGSVNDIHGFKNGRQFAAWIGLTPKLYASGETHKMGGISKRGNGELRKMLIHGARAIINWCKEKNDKLNVWIKQLLSRMTGNRVVVALANKLARIIWAVLAGKTHFDVTKTCA